MTTYNRTPIYNVYNAGFFAGFQRTQTYKNSGPITIPATNGTATIPGPAAGLLRVFTNISLTAQGSSSAISAVLQPSGLQIARGTTAAANTATANLQGTTPLVLGAGESIDVSNTGAAASTLLYTYFDTPVGNRHLVRAAFGAALVELIPAADPGFYNKFLVVFGGGLQNTTSFAARVAAFIVNDDTAAAIVDTYLNSVLVGRSGSTPANVSQVLAFGPDLCITQALEVSTNAAVATRNLPFIGCYETFEGTP